jgi:hypothetical protein
MENRLSSSDGMGPKVHWMLKASKYKVPDYDFLNSHFCCDKGHGPLSCKDEIF